MKRISSLVLCLMLLLSVVPFDVCAQKSEQKVVRVGWYESTYCYRDQFGERRGVAYEYQRRIAAHTGWTYEVCRGQLAEPAAKADRWRNRPAQ